MVLEHEFGGETKGGCAPGGPWALPWEICYAFLSLLLMSYLKLLDSYRNKKKRLAYHTVMVTEQFIEIWV